MRWLLLSIAALAGLPLVLAAAQPQIPSTFYGTATPVTPAAATATAAAASAIATPVAPGTTPGTPQNPPTDDIRFTPPSGSSQGGVSAAASAGGGGDDDGFPAWAIIVLVGGVLV